MNSEQDNDLVIQWQSGDLASFARLVQRWQHSVARFLGHYLQKQDQVEDLCQEVFLRVFQARDRYRPDGAFSTWIYAIARNVARDAIRKEKSLVKLSGHWSRDATTLDEAPLEKNEIGQLLRAALQALPEATREVIVLRHYEKLSFAEMSRLLHVPESTLKSRFANGLRQIRDWLRDHGYGPEEFHQ